MWGNILLKPYHKAPKISTMGFETDGWDNILATIESLLLGCFNSYCNLKTFNVLNLNS